MTTWVFMGLLLPRFDASETDLRAAGMIRTDPSVGMKECCKEFVGRERHELLGGTAVPAAIMRNGAVDTVMIVSNISSRATIAEVAKDARCKGNSEGEHTCSFPGHESVNVAVCDSLVVLYSTTNLDSYDDYARLAGGRWLRDRKCRIRPSLRPKRS